MRFGLVHRILLDTLVALGMLSLVATGEFSRIGAVALVVTLSLSFFLPASWQERRGMRLFGTYAPLVLFAVQLLRWADGSNPLTIAVEFTALLQIIRVATRRGAAHDQQLITLSLLQLIAATVLGGGLTFALCFIGFVLITPSALVLSHLRREVEGNYRQGARDRTGLPVDVPRILRSRRVISRGFVLFISLLSLPVFLVTTIIFVSFPRVGLSLLLLEPSRPTRMVGFSDRVDLGGVGALRSDPTLAMRITYAELPAEPPRRIALYLRGTALDRYEKSSWARTKMGRHSLSRIGTQYALDRFPDPVRDPSLTIELEPIEPPVLFVPEQTVALELLPHSNQMFVSAPIIYQGAESELRYARLEDRRGPKYRVFLQSAGTSRPPVLNGEDRQRYLQLPDSFTRALHDVARRWAGGDVEPLTKANQVLAHLRKDYRYDLNSPSSKMPNPLEHFLLVSKRGHCEFYSTAMALLLRGLDIPTRNVTGFAGATYNRYGRFYAVRQGDAHSWVEAWIDGYGWKRFDPTPTSPAVTPTAYERWGTSLRDILEATSQSWSKHIERYDIRQQVELFGGMRNSLRSVTKWAIPSGLLKRTLTAVVVVALFVGVAIHVWRKLKRRSSRENLSEATATSQEIVRLYQLLEQVLSKRGLSRLSSTPPLAYAQGLLAMGQPFASEIVTLTERYLEVRFGGRTLHKDDANDYALRVAALRRLSATEWKRHHAALNDPAFEGKPASTTDPT